jgi:hypothetical protein
MEKGDFATMNELNRKVVFGWVIGLFLFLWMGYFFGYFVATDKAMSGLKQREADWESNSRTFQSQNRSLSEELARLKSNFADKENELRAAQLKSESLKRELVQAQLTVKTVEEVLYGKISRLEEANALQKAALDEAHKLLVAKRIVSSDHFQIESPLTIKQIVTAKQAFNDIQHEVAAGNYKGLNLTNGYQKLRAIFDTPDLEHLIGLYDAAKGQSQ